MKTKNPSCCRKCLGSRDISFVNCNGCEKLEKWKKWQIKKANKNIIEQKKGEWKNEKINN